jgi:chromosome segregation ATPase
MNTKHLWTSGLLVAALAVGCDKGSDVNKEVEDLKQAQQESPKVAGDLQRELDDKKAEVAQLQEKVALAKQGVTDDVVKEKNDVKEAMKNEAQEVREEIAEAQGAAKAHTDQSENAARQLEQTENAQRVKAQVKTETTVVPSETKTEVRTEQHQVPVENSRVVERRTTTTEAAGGRDGGM